MRLSLVQQVSLGDCICDYTRVLTCDEGGHSPANQVVESHWSVVDVSHLADHAVDVQPLQEEPGEGAEVEEVQQDSHDCAHKLQRKGGEKQIRTFEIFQD